MLPGFSLRRIRTYETYDDCPICISEICACKGKRKLVKETPCGHCFHPTCLNRWLRKHDTCPMCRTTLVEKPPPPPPIGWRGLYRHNVVRDLTPFFEQVMGDIIEREPEEPTTPRIIERPRGLYWEVGQPFIFDYGDL